MPQSWIIGVIVSYQPSFASLDVLLSALQAQVDSIVLIDNGSSQDLKDWLHARNDDSIHGICLNENLGIAAAQNIGIKWAREQGATHVILSDQDSLPAPDMVATLLAAVESKSAKGIKVAAVGPRYLDSRQQNPPPFIQIRGLQLHRQPCDGISSIVPVDYLIASGCMFAMSTLDDVGLMSDRLFIDYVDIEWGLRAKQLGYQCYGVCGAKMKHDLGDAPIRFAGQTFPVRSPLRHYYMFRNAIWLYFHTSLPFNWKLVDGWRLLLKYGFYSLYAKPRLSHLKMMSLGIWHGLIGRLGRF
jgi:rhamnosyltransferase